MAERDRLGRWLAYPAHLSYWIVSIAIINVWAGEVFGTDLSVTLGNFLGPKYQGYLQSYAKIASSIVLIFLIVLVLDLIIQARHEKRKWNGVFEELHSSLDRITSFSERVRNQIPASEEWDASDIDKFEELVVVQYGDIATLVCNIFEQYTGHNCHVSFKTLDSAGNITTQARDHSPGSLARQGIDQHITSFPYTSNTAFKNILEKKDVFCFVSNRLRLRSVLGWYANANESWPKHYSAVAVAPITTAIHPAEIKRENTFGFLCVDNKGGGFDRGPCLELLTHVAKHLQKLTVLLAQVHIRPKPTGKS